VSLLTLVEGPDCHDISPESEVNARRALVTSMHEANPQPCAICRLSPKCLVWHTGGAAAPGGQAAGNPASAPAAAGGPNAQPLDMFAPQVYVSAVCCRAVEKKPFPFLLFMSEGRVGGRFACQVKSCTCGMSINKSDVCLMCTFKTLAVPVERYAPFWR